MSLEMHRVEPGGQHLQHALGSLALREDGVAAEAASCSDEAKDKKNNLPLIVNTGADASYANYNAIYLPKLHLDLDINFENKIIYGVAKYEIGKRTSDTLILDIAHLQIQKVSVITKRNKEINTDYLIGVEDSIKGSPLSISIPSDAKNIVIYYQTNEGNPAFHWYKQSIKQPYLYTIPNENLTRNILPCQDLENLTLKMDATIKSTNQLVIEGSDWQDMAIGLAVR